jgi:hypothetical protein
VLPDDGPFWAKNVVNKFPLYTIYITTCYRRCIFITIIVTTTWTNLRLKFSSNYNEESYCVVRNSLRVCFLFFLFDMLALIFRSLSLVSAIWIVMRILKGKANQAPQTQRHHCFLLLLHATSLCEGHIHVTELSRYQHGSNKMISITFYG